MFRLTNLINSVVSGKKNKSLDGSIIIWNFTNRCNLLCHHCYSKADANRIDTLTLEQIKQQFQSLQRLELNL